MPKSNTHYIDEELKSLQKELKEYGYNEDFDWVSKIPQETAWEELSAKQQNRIVWLIERQTETYKQKHIEALGKIEELEKKRDLQILDAIDELDKNKAELFSELSKQDFPTLEICAYEMVQRSNQKKFRTYREAYRWAVGTCTIKGKPINSWKQLEKAVERYYDANKHIPLTERMRRDLEG